MPDYLRFGFCCQRSYLLKTKCLYAKINIRANISTHFLRYLLGSGNAKNFSPAVGTALSFFRLYRLKRVSQRCVSVVSAVYLDTKFL